MPKLPLLFHVPLKLYSQKEYCIPKGPSFKKAKRIRFSLKGSQIELFAPKHRAASFHESKSPKTNYDLNPRYIDTFIRGGVVWRIFNPVFKVWDFYGPWFTGWKGKVIMAVTIVTLNEPTSDSSLFHPRVFENMLVEFLTSNYKAENMELSGRQRHVAPVDWRPKLDFPCIAAGFDIHGGAQDRGNFERCLAFPLSNEFFCFISFTVQRPLAFIHSHTVPEDDVDDWISDQPMIELVNNVLNSVKFTLSPEAEAQQAKALEGLADTSLTKTFAPLNWGPEGGSQINDELLAKFIREHSAKKEK